MKRFVRFCVLILAVVPFVQCGQKKITNSQKTIPFGQYVQLQPDGLLPPPRGMVYQAWTFQLEESGGVYSAQFHPLRMFGWNDYAYKFTDPVTGEDVGYTFKAAAGTQNLFTNNPTAFMRADSLGKMVEKLLRGQAVVLSGAARNLSGLVGFLLSVEPEKETGPDTAFPASPFLVGVSNDSGIVTMTYPIDYRGPDLIPGYFLATPTDGLSTLCPCEFNDSTVIRDEARGVWLGEFDTTRVDLGKGAGHPDPVLVKLSQDLLPGWRFAAWLQRGSYQPARAGNFYRADSADLGNTYAANPDSVFPFPGEDFFTNPPPGVLDEKRGLLGCKLMITLEPARPDDSTMFPVVVFQDTLPQSFASRGDVGEASHRNLQYNFLMQNRARFFPKMQLRIRPETRK